MRDVISARIFRGKDSFTRRKFSFGDAANKKPEEKKEEGTTPLCRGACRRSSQLKTVSESGRRGQQLFCSPFCPQFWCTCWSWQCVSGHSSFVRFVRKHKKFPRLAPVSPEIKPRLSPIAHFSRRRSKHRRETKQMSCFLPNIVLKHCFTRESCSWEFLFNDLRK